MRAGVSIHYKSELQSSFPTDFLFISTGKENKLDEHYFKSEYQVTTLCQSFLNFWIQSHYAALVV